MLHSQSQMELQDTARLPLVIREADIEYQLHRLTLFSRLTQVRPADTDTVAHPLQPTDAGTEPPLIAVTAVTHPVTWPIPPILKESMLFFAQKCIHLNLTRRLFAFAWSPKKPAHPVAFPNFRHVKYSVYK